jgi:hypothetical protein
VTLICGHIIGLADNNFCTCVCYSDTLIEEEVEGNSVADIFKLYGESFFRDKEVSWKGLCQVFIFFGV